MFRTANYVDNTCLRCGKTVYPTDKIGPLKDFTFFHSGCFRCVVCNSKLTLKTYYNNQHSQDDKEVYCMQHVPKINPGKFDAQSIGIKVALNAPKSSTFVNEQIRPGGKSSIDADAIGIRAHINAHKESHGSNNGSSEHKTITQQLNEQRWGHFDSSALHIQHALKATEVQRKYSKPHEQPLEEFLDREEQVRLEAIHKEEEDRLYKQFLEQRDREEKKVVSSVQEEWEVELEKLTAKFEREMGKKKGNNDELKVLTIKHNKEKDEVKKNMTIKREKKKESVQRKLLEQERAATAALVEKHSQEMMHLIQEKRAQYETSEANGEYVASEYPAQAPPPAPPAFAKVEIYKNPDEFAEVDNRAITVAQEDQQTFTDLVRQLVAGCANDVEKARAIFRWITVKKSQFSHV